MRPVAVVAGAVQGKAGEAGKAGKAGKTGKIGETGQTKPRLGTTGKPAKQFRAENYPKLVLAGPGTPRAPNQTFLAPNGSPSNRFAHPRRESISVFRCGSRQIGPTPSISTFLGSFLTPKMPKIAFSGRVSKKSAKSPRQNPRNRPGWLKMPPQGPGGPWGPIFRYFPPIFGPPWAPLGGPWGGPGGPLFSLSWAAALLALWGSTSGAVYTCHCTINRCTGQQ